MVNVTGNFAINYMRLCVLPEILKNRPEWLQSIEVSGHLVIAMHRDGTEIRATPFFEDVEGLAILMLREDGTDFSHLCEDFEFCGDPKIDAETWCYLVANYLRFL